MAWSGLYLILGITSVVKLNKFSPDADHTEKLRMAKERSIEIVPIFTCSLRADEALRGKNKFI